MSPPLPSSTELGLDPAAQRVDELAREILGETYLHFQVGRLTVEEDAREGTVQVTCQLFRSGTDERVTVDGRGVGLVDAIFEGMLKGFADEYPSLKTIRVADFGLTAGFEGTKSRGSDALAEVALRVRNSENVEFTFRQRTPSITLSSARAALDALTFFVNSERAYIQLHRALTDAIARRRSDLVDRYRTMMGTLVSATSYSEVIERLKADAAQRGPRE